MRLRITAAFAGVLLVALSACSTSKDDGAAASTSAPSVSSDSSSSTTPDSTPSSAETTTPDSTIAPIVDPRSPGVTDTEIKIGITYPDLSNLKAVIGFDHGDYQAAYNAVIDKINADGGVAGRKLVPVFGPVDPSVGDAGPAACTKLTQDDPVFVAMGFFLDDDVLCYVQDADVPTLGGSQSPERLGKATSLWLSTDPSSESGADGIAALAASGEFSSKLAVVGTASDKAQYEAAFAPVLEAAGITPVEVAYLDASTGDANSVRAAARTLAERLQADGVDQVLMIGNAAAALPGGLADTTYRPRLVFTDLNVATIYSSGAGNDLSVLEGGLVPGVFDANEEFDTLGDPTKECLDIQRAAGLELKKFSEVPRGESQQITSSLSACRFLYLLKAILEKAGTDLNYGTFATAAYSLGDIVLPGSPDPYHFGPGSARDGNPKQLVYNWDAGLGRWVTKG